MEAGSQTLSLEVKTEAPPPWYLERKNWDIQWVNQAKRKAESWSLGQNSHVAFKTGDTELSAREKTHSQFRICLGNPGKKEQVKSSGGWDNRKPELNTAGPSLYPLLYHVPLLHQSACEGGLAS